MSMTPDAFIDLLNNLNNELASDSLEAEQTEMTAIVRDSVIENFLDQRNYEGEAWEERKGDYFHDPLKDTLLMFGAATVQGSPGSIMELSREKVVMGISEDEVDYAAKQNFGYPDSNLPAREFMFVREEHQPRLDEPLVEGMERILDKQVSRRQS